MGGGGIDWKNSRLPGRGHAKSDPLAVTVKTGAALFPPAEPEPSALPMGTRGIVC